MQTDHSVTILHSAKRFNGELLEEATTGDEYVQVDIYEASLCFVYSLFDVQTTKT